MEVAREGWIEWTGKLHEFVKPEEGKVSTNKFTKIGSVDLRRVHDARDFVRPPDEEKGEYPENTMHYGFVYYDEDVGLPFINIFDETHDRELFCPAHIEALGKPGKEEQAFIDSGEKREAAKLAKKRVKTFKAAYKKIVDTGRGTKARLPWVELQAYVGRPEVAKLFKITPIAIEKPVAVEMAEIDIEPVIG